MGDCKIPALRWAAALLLLAILVVALDAVTLLAQEGPMIGQGGATGETMVASEARYTEIRGFLDWFQRGGKFMYPLLTDVRGAITIDSIPVIPEQIEGIVRERMTLNPDLMIRIETDPTASYEMMILVLDRVRRAQATRISLKLGLSA